VTGHTIRLTGVTQREYARRLILAAPDYAVVTISAGDRTLDQNALMWCLLSEVSRAKPQGRKHTPEVWKALFMNACGHETQFQMGLSGEPFPVGFRTSRLSRAQMSELIEFIYSYGAEHGVIWHDTYAPREGENGTAVKNASTDP